MKITDNKSRKWPNEHTTQRLIDNRTLNAATLFRVHAAEAPRVAACMNIELEEYDGHRHP